jgi:hypothetical protein
LSDITIKKPLHLNQKGWNGQRWLFLPSTVLTVSGSRGLWTLPIEFNSQIGNRKLAIGNAQTLSRHCGSPETLFGFQSVETILELFISGCKLGAFRLHFAPLREPNTFHAKALRKFGRRREGTWLKDFAANRQKRVHMLSSMQLQI